MTLRELLDAATPLGKLLLSRSTEDDNGCLVWGGAIDNGGYGNYSSGGRTRKSHRVSYEEFVGPIPDGLTLDHLCRNRACINPAHLEPVTIQENVARGDGPTARNGRKTHCKYGHEFTPENTILTRNRRYCRECRNRASRTGYQRLKDQRNAYRELVFDMADALRAIERDRKDFGSTEEMNATEFGGIGTYFHPDERAKVRALLARLDRISTQTSEQTAEGDAQHGSAHPHHREDAVATGHGPAMAGTRPSAVCSPSCDPGDCGEDCGTA